MEKQNLKPGENKVTYLSEGKKISALVYVPEDYKEGEKRPAIVITRPGSGVKEQTAGLYAQKLSEKGFVTLAFDPRGFGDSEGHAQVENPYNIVEDTKNSVSFIRTLPQVDKDKTFNIGLCAGSGYATYTAALDARIKGTAMISPFLNAGDLYRQAVGGAEKLRSTLIPMYSDARQKYFETGEDMPMKPVPETDEEKQQVLPIQVGMMEYYLPGKPGGVQNCPNWKNNLSLYSFEMQIMFSVFDVLPILGNLPFFMAVGTEAYTYENSIEFYNKVKGPKEKLVIEGAGHFDLYWKPEHVDPIVQRVADFFKKHM